MNRSTVDDSCARAQEARWDGQTPAGSSLKWDFDGNIELGVVGLHLPRAVLVSELLNQGFTGKGKPAHLDSNGRWCYTEKKPMSVTKKEKQAPPCK